MGREATVVCCNTGSGVGGTHPHKKPAALALGGVVQELVTTFNQVVARQHLLKAALAPWLNIKDQWGDKGKAA